MRKEPLKLENLFYASLVLSLCLACGKPRQEEVVASFNDQVITVKDMQNSLKRRKDIYQPEDATSSAMILKVKKSLLDEMINRKLLLNEALLQGTTVSSEEMSLEIGKFKTNYSELSFQKMLQERGVTNEEWTSLKRENLIVNKYLSQGSIGEGEVSETELKKYYEEHIERFKTPESVHVRQIVTDTKEKAEAILRRVQLGENFAKLAYDLSLSPDRKVGGDLGYIRRGEFPREFEVCFSMSPGEISPIIPSLYGFHIFKIIQKEPPKTLSFEEVNDKILAERKQKNREEAVQKLVEQLRERAKVVVNEDILKRITL